MVDAALIELEGVLFETTELRRASLRDAFAKHGIDLMPDPELVDGATSRAGVAAVVAATGTEHDDVLVDLIAARADRIFSQAIAARGAALVLGAREFVEGAASAGRIGVVTRMSRSDATSLLRLAELDSLLAVTVTGDDTFDGKPSPEGYRLALSRLRRQRGAELATVVALEDGSAGIRAARQAGIRCIAVGALPPHVAVEADAYVTAVLGHTLSTLDLISLPGRERVQ